MTSQLRRGEGGSVISDCPVTVGVHVNVINILYVPVWFPYRVEYQRCACTRTSVISSRPWLLRTTNLQCRRVLLLHQSPWRRHSGTTASNVLLASQDT